MEIVKLIILTGLSAVLYRMGGTGGKWYFNTKMRDLGCPTACFLFMLGTPSAWWVHFISFGLLFGALTTYWDKLFGYDNFWFHGFVCGLAYLPYAFYTGHWSGFIIRAFTVAIIMGAVSAISNNDVVEETGRGASLVATLPLM